MKPNSFSTEQLNNAIRLSIIICVGVLTLFILVQIVSSVREYPLIGEGGISGEAQNIITVSGQADMDVKPDMTTFSFSTDSDGKTVEEAQSKSATLNNKAIAFLKSKGVSDADIKTTNYNTETKYSGYKPCISSYTPCGQESVPVGFTTYQSVEIKVRNIDKEPSKTGELIAGLGAIGVKASSPQNTVENPDAFKNAVRQQAIMKARKQAEILARDLGVRLVRVTSFSDNTYPNYPTVYSMGAMAKNQDAGAPIVPEISAGTNKINADVTITYQIR